MFELIRGAASNLLPGPPRPGVFNPDGSQVTLDPVASLEAPALGGDPPEPELGPEPAEAEPGDREECDEQGPSAFEESLPPFPEVASEIAGPAPLAVGERVDLAARARIEGPQPSAPEALASEELSLKVTQPRCPFCHDEILPGSLQEACKACRAWHHEACWREGRSRCSACRAPAVTQAIHVRVGGAASDEAGVDSDLATSWTLIATASLAYSLILIPLREFGFHPKTLGYALTQAWGAIPGLLALSSLFIASGMSARRWRQRFHRAAWVIVALTAVLTLYAMVSSSQAATTHIRVW